MKKILNISILLAALTLASSCNRDEGGLEPQQPLAVTITAGAAETRTVIDGDAVKWEDGDKIALHFTHPTDGRTLEHFTTSLEAASHSADFTGSIALEVTREDSGYDDHVLAVYPHDAVSESGDFVFTLPAEQRARENGAFAAGLNLTSAALSLEDISDDGQASATFRNALSILRFAVDGDDVTSVTLTGAAPLAGKAPFVLDTDGRLVIDGTASWAENDKQISVTLKPADGAECFTAGTVYNLLVLPGTHSSLIATLALKDFGDYEKTSSTEVTFAPAKYYTLNFNSDTEALVTEITEGLDNIEASLLGLEERIASLETAAEKVAVLVDQIQSVALVTEYLDNAVYAAYAKKMYGGTKMDIEVSYMVRPAAAMQLLLEVCEESGNLSEVLCGQLDDKNGSITRMTVKSAVLNGDILTVTLDANTLWDGFYEGRDPAAMALQISDGNTAILSDFANLIPMNGAVLNISKTEGIPVLKGASMSMSFGYGAYDFSKCNVTLESVGFSTQPTVRFSNGNGTISAFFGENDNLEGMSIKVKLTCEDETNEKTLTFAEGGKFEVDTYGDVDYVGGEVSFNVTRIDFGSYNISFQGNDWIYQTNSGSNARLTVEQNDGAARTASASFTVNNGSYSYTKSVTITQKEYGSAIDESNYFQDKESKTLQSATAGYTPLNIVIVGDGYQKKDLRKGGKFERSAGSAMEAFFGVEPYKSFRDRFRVVMVAYESQDAGLSKVDGSGNIIENRNTYFKSVYKGGGDTYVNLHNGYESVKNVVKTDLGWSSDAYYYRTIVIMLINTDEGIGSNGAPDRDYYNGSAALGEDYASFAVAMVTANNTETSNLIRHEAGGHAFGRLGDEYPSKMWDSEVNEWHNMGWYRNITVDQSQWNWNKFIGLSGYEEVTYYQPNTTYWCPVDHAKHNSIMYNNQNRYNAPCRQIIYERIIRQTEGASAYSWEKFLEYDQRNLSGGSF